MANIKCTKKLLNELKVQPSVGKSGIIGDWHANLLLIDRRKCVLFTNDKTLFSFVVTGMKKPQFQNFYEVFRLNLFKALMSEDLPQNQIEYIFNEHSEISITKTDSRSVLASMNEIAFQMKYCIYVMGGLVNLDVVEVNRELNRIPMGAIGNKYSIEQLSETLNGIDI